MTKLAKSIAEKIKKEKIEPIPRWKFVLKHAGFWGLFGFATLLGAAAFSIITYTIFDTDFELLDYTNSKAGFFLATLPFYWLISFGILVVLTIFIKRKMKRGYRHSVLTLITWSLGGSLLLGLGFFFVGGAEALDKYFGEKIPLYHNMDEKKMEMWSQPEQGRLSGIVMEIEADHIVILEDFSGKTWTIDTKAVKFPRVHRELPPEVEREFHRLFAPGEKIKILGEQMEEDFFRAEHILPWKRPLPHKKLPPIHEDCPAGSQCKGPKNFLKEKKDPPRIRE